MRVAVNGTRTTALASLQGQVTRDEVLWDAGGRGGNDYKQW